MTVNQPDENKLSDKKWGNMCTVRLERQPGKQLGMCLVGGKVNISDKQDLVGIFIKDIIQSTPAAACNEIKVGDRILSVNSRDISSATQNEAINLIKEAGNVINLEIQSIDKLGVQEPEQSVSIDRKLGTDVTKATDSVLEQPSDSGDDSDEDESGRTISAYGKEIDRKSAGNLKRSSQDKETEDEYGYTKVKIEKKYGHLGKVIRVAINRDAKNSLGLALAGNKNRNELSSFVSGVNERSDAKHQDLKVGDEILEVNGNVLHKVSHLNTAVKIKAIPDKKLVVILLRKILSDPSLAVHTTSFPIEIDEFDQLRENYTNVKSLTVQKVGPSFGIMIVEGKHAELGQGIFISDIQENSNAQRAGLVIGQMILAVNKDLLIDCKYDEAAAVLKRVEGNVTLTVCTPSGSSIPEPPPKVADKKVEQIKQEPSTAEIIKNQNTLIEINCDNKSLGVDVIGGKGSLVKIGAAVVYINPAGPAQKDQRLKVMDVILDINGTRISSETHQDNVYKLFKQFYPIVKLTVMRSEPTLFKEACVTITKKAGKDIGIEFDDNKPMGLYIKEIVHGGIAELEHSLLKGDIITHVNSEDIRSLEYAVSVALVRASQSKVEFKVYRPGAGK